MSGTLTPFANPLVPSQSDYLLFIRQHMQIGPAYLPDSSLWVMASYTMALEQVYLVLQSASALIYTLAVYNLAADRLLHFATDVPGQTKFEELRKALNINGFATGLIASSSDAGTSQSMTVPEWARTMTMAEIDLTRTVYGRTYLGFAQMAGRSIWGLT